MANRHEHAVRLDLRGLVGRRVAQIERRDSLAVAVDAFDDGVHEQVDLRILACALDHDLGGAELVATVDQRDRRAEACEEVRLLHRGVAAAHHDNRLAAEEEAVARRTIRDSLAGIFEFARHVEMPVIRSGGHNDRARLEILAAAQMHGFEFALQIRRFHVVEHDLGAEAFGLPLHAFHEVGAHHAVGEAGVVLDLRGVDELAARGERPCDDDGLETCTGQIDRGRIAGGARSDNDDVMYCCCAVHDSHNRRGFWIIPPALCLTGCRCGLRDVRFRPFPHILMHIWLFSTVAISPLTSRND